jgi:hypothetical protein
MNRTVAHDTHVIAALCEELLRLAHQEDELAADEAARVPYWAPTPASVTGHRAAATALREQAGRLTAECRHTGLAA